ncbi:hypothetical protein CROQUDRAFT_108213 [Cronartium quercuum f. sp. fusiforme G11]|uniref:Chromosome transmission fidelity protein 8 n=1 Tax=Cronartium quercuum f. sp. fusiforme G11 TaxID=708437 RepID=A0A9P6NJT0_9BASI|nr:hypothetical protein CROQUDRAFT_108213 [Cronartium quercuum f. sp. fusiforme G11]
MRLPISVTQKVHSSQASLSSDSTFTLVNGETVIVELQGKLEISYDEGPNVNQEAIREGLEIGRLDLSNPKKPLLTIGNHQLEGKIVKLTTPLALLRKMESASVSAHSDPDHRTQLDIVSIVERKFVFAKRPSPIVKMSEI